MDDINLGILCVVLSAASYGLFKLAQFISPPPPKDLADWTRQVIGKANPGHSALRAGWEERQGLARTNLNRQLADELDSFGGVLRGTHKILLVERELEMEFEELCAKHRTNLYREENMQIALRAASEARMRLEFWEQITMRIESGWGSTLTEAKRKELLDAVELKRQEAEKMLGLRYAKKADKFEQEKRRRWRDEQ
jgi:hypothetical protein